ncbi:diguanylate cyclase regulator RdcB family protein [Moraxella marmotae]|uniref:diguanylate cyclase regulator RdcB family protein n=1 Tax=Moraxella marmotae TaxID=3344520 RepID=UPI0035F3E566
MNELNKYETAINRIFPYVKDKMVVDIVNGIDSAKRLNQEAQKKSMSFIGRNLDSLLGKQAIRQADINDLIIHAVEGCQEHLKEISGHIENHAYAIRQVSEKVVKTQQDLDKTQEDLAYAICSFVNEFAKVDGQISGLSEDLNQVKGVVGNLQNDVHHKFAKVDGQISGLSEDLNQVKGVVGNLQNDVHHKFAKVNGQISGLSEDLNQVKGAVGNLQNDVRHKFAKVDGQISQLSLDFNQIKGVVGNLQSDVRHLYHQYDDLTHRVSKLELRDKADGQLENVLSTWQVGAFDDLSPLAQCFVVLDRLRWGAFGSYFDQLDYKDQQQELQTLANRMIIIQKELLNVPPKEHLPKEVWLKIPNPNSEQSFALHQALAYQGDWSQALPHVHNLAFAATQSPMLGDSNIMHPMIDINRVNTRMARSIFEYR